jgi:hypothetical protein
MIYSLSPEKAAEELSSYVDMAGQTYDLRDLQKVSAEIYKQAFGTDLNPGNLAELRDVLPTMPTSDVPLFLELSGVKPV